MMYNCNNHKTIFSHNKGVPVANSIHHSNSIYNYFKSLKLGLFLSDVYLNHLMIIMVSVFLRGYRGKTIDFAEVSCMHRTTTAYFLNHGKWDDSALQDILKARVIHTIYQEAYRSGKPIFCIVDDTIASHTKPSSQALHPIEAAYFHQSHLKRHAILILCSISMLIPFLWMISSSLKDVQELYAIPPYWIPKHVAWENYVYMFEQAPWFVYFGNTIFITVFTILGQLITCSMAAYAFARLNFKGKNILFIIYLGTMMIPFQAVMIPQFKIIKYMGLIDTKSSLVAVGIFNAFGTFLLRQFFLTIPKELEEAAKIDGCSYPRIFWEVILKNSKPALMTLIIFTFMNTWNDFLRPLIFINSEEKWTLAMGLAQFQGTYVSQWNQMMAGALISMLPILLVYIFAQKYFVQGIVMSGIKG